MYVCVYVYIYVYTCVRCERVCCVCAHSLSLSCSQSHRANELQKKNTELEKFKFVLDYKIRELNRQIHPREVDIKMVRTFFSLGVCVCL